MRMPFIVLAATAFSMTAGCTTSNLAPAPAVVDNTSYRLGSGDGLRVIVYGEDKLSGEYRISDSGAVSLPLIGTIKAAGMSVEELGEKIAVAYRTGGFLTSPRVAAEVLSYRPFFILGEVMKPGQYPFIPGMTVSQAIATANGYSYRAAKSKVAITRWGQSEETVYTMTPGAMVSPGDTIRVLERHL